MVSPRRAALLLALGCVSAGCGSSADASESCLRASGAEVCADGAAGSVQISAEGLLPGSDLVLDGPAGEQVIEVGDDGRPIGAVGLLGTTGSDPVVVDVTGTAADGTEVGGQLLAER